MILNIENSFEDPKLRVNPKRLYFLSLNLINFWIFCDALAVAVVDFWKWWERGVRILPQRSRQRFVI